MKALTLLGLALSLASCAVPIDEEDTASVEQHGYYQWDKCDPGVCGLNAPELANGFFHDINLDGEENGEGYALVSVSKNGALYRLSVSRGRITATSLINASTTLSGYNLVGLKLRLRKRSSSTGLYNYYNISIAEVAYTQYWAKRTDGQPTPSIETYQFFFQGENSQLGAFLCRDGQEFVWGGDPRAMRKHHALVFEGDRIAVRTLQVQSLDTRWFNIGCAETALAKMHLNGHTHAAMFSGLPFVSRLERQTFLKMITADYCGTGRPFTVAGQPLRWTDDNGTMTIASTVTKVMEARWDSEGATCLNTPRLDAHQTDAGELAFPDGVEAAFPDTCARPPRCASIAPIHHLTSWNPTPFTTN